LEAPPGFEPGIKALQASALPLGDGAVKREAYSSRARANEQLVALDLDRRKQVLLGGVGEAGREATLHRAAEGVVGVGRERRRVERLGGPVGERDLTRAGVVAVYEEGGVLDVEPAAEPAELDDEGPLGLGPADAGAQRGREARVGDADALVPEAAVAPQDQTERAERRRTLAQRFSGRTVPSGSSTRAPRKS
jgi:hypothetical protein